MSVAILVGSLRKASFSRKIAHALIAQAPIGLDCRIVEFGDLPLYSEDLDPDPPAAWSRFRTELKAADAVLFVTPEYNRSMPGPLKNAIDVASRPAGENVFDGVPAGVVSVTPYKQGAFGANHALRQTLVFLNMPAMPQPEAYIGNAGDLLSEDGTLTDGGTARFLTKFMAAFARWIVTNRKGAGGSGFDSFLPRREAIALAYVNGDAGPLDEMLTRHDPATFFSPGGDTPQGAAVVAERYRADAASFENPSRSRLEILQSGTGGDLAFWTGLQHAEVCLKGRDNPVPMTLRVTEVFRREDGGWKLVHRHADMAQKEGG
jgi:NAD(P)H-dependent FMN reductase/ketosteroid isomerase-like protein